MITQDAVRGLSGTDVYGSDGEKIGTAGQVYLDNDSGNPEWVSVRTGLFGRKESFVPLRDASLSGGRLEVPFGKNQVKNAPAIDEDGELSPAEEDALYEYYGLSSSAGTGTTQTDRTERRDTVTHTATHTGTDTGTGRTGTDRETETVGRDTSGPTTDDAMTRSEEKLVAGTRTEQTGKARLRKYVVSEQQQVKVPVAREEVRLEREPITDANRDKAMDGPDISDEEHEVTLEAERPVVTTETVPVERVRLGKETVTEEETVSGEVRKEQIELKDDRR